MSRAAQLRCGARAACAALAGVLLAAGAACAQPAAAAADGATGGSFGIPAAQHMGDLDGMIGRRTIRVLTLYNKTSFFIDNGTPHGVAYEAFTRFADGLNRQLKLPGSPLQVLFIPVEPAALLPALEDGRGDIAAAYLSIPPTHSARVTYTEPILRDVSEIVVTGPRAPDIRTLDDLAGKTVVVRGESPYAASLAAQNEAFARRGLPPIRIEAAPSALEDDDLLEMVNAGLLDIVIAEAHLAHFWKLLLPGIVPHDDVAVKTGGAIAWAVRRDSPELLRELDAFIRANGVDTTFGAVLFRRYFDDTRLVRNATSPAEIRKFEALATLFRRYGDRYGLDWMLMAAQGYQESRLDQSVRSAVGAVGIMQIMPATGAALGVGDVREVEPNIHAGAKYVRMLIDQHFAAQPMDERNRLLFAFAAYNAGPAAIERMREEARREGRDPNVWFNQVERVVAQQQGRQTVDYVRNIYKYYVAYTLAREANLARARAGDEVAKQRAR